VRGSAELAARLSSAGQTRIRPERRAQLAGDGMIYIATTQNDREFVVLKDGKVIAGPFNTAAEAVKARDALSANSPVIVDGGN
jgi:hypothetical protein